MIVLVALVSCGNNKARLLTRTWKINDLKYSQEIPESMKPTIQAEIDRLRAGYSITYFADNTYKAVNEGASTTGKWQLNYNGTKIITTGPDGNTVEYQILELTDKRFSFSAVIGGQKVIFEFVPSP